MICTFLDIFFKRPVHLLSGLFLFRLKYEAMSMDISKKFEDENLQFYWSFLKKLQMASPPPLIMFSTCTCKDVSIASMSA